MRLPSSVWLIAATLAFSTGIHAEEAVFRAPLAAPVLFGTDVVSVLGLPSGATWNGNSIFWAAAAEGSHHVSIEVRGAGTLRGMSSTCQ